MYTVVFIRHGESTWNKENRFCGWVDQDLTEEGKVEARQAGEALKASGIEFGALFTSVLKRAINTADIVLETLGQQGLPTVRHWRLNERHYGALQGLNKVETAEKYGLEQVNLWRRSYNVPPPPCAEDSEYHPKNDTMYNDIPRDAVPNGESLELVVKRVLPYWDEVVVPEMKKGKPVLVVAHGNTIRSLVKVIKNISDEDISGLNIPNGVPLLVTFNCDMTLNEYKFLISEEELKAKMDAVAKQAQKK
ncbi:2-3-bisphosphoglycerate-dependent phosphoglycerate mutase [Babesia gibsoni]|uniref:phosphoglycerate mutase (2,3-diphosphoglycerate-dependent) n=1 Tax=Babesia gibsoni TaxID=33632 RepID=A0AAD8UTV3_BABGI|nr:2-3-bisphosphoglycerate-dependent phosphoglycerate mutase [Babesia gibsoni]